MAVPMRTAALACTRSQYSRRQECPLAYMQDQDMTRHSDHGHVIWLTGLSGAGKSTIARGAQRGLSASGYACCVVDGDDLRKGLCSDLGFTEADRLEQARRACEVARLIANSGVVVIVALISPMRESRDLARRNTEAGRFSEVFVNAPLDVCESRDVKGLYKRARSGAVTHFTGVSAPYERPEAPDLEIRTDVMSPEDSVSLLCAWIIRRVTR